MVLEKWWKASGYIPENKGLKFYYYMSFILSFILDLSAYKIYWLFYIKWYMLFTNTSWGHKEPHS